MRNTFGLGFLQQSWTVRSVSKGRRRAERFRSGDREETSSLRIPAVNLCSNEDLVLHIELDTGWCDSERNEVVFTINKERRYKNGDVQGGKRKSSRQSPSSENIPLPQQVSGLLKVSIPTLT